MIVEYSTSIQYHQFVPMFSLSLLFFSSVILSYSASQVSAVAAVADIHEEFCQWETFNVTCRPDHFILITSARYGRMKVGRCLPVEYYTGCSVDVQSQLEARCSGRRQCVVAIADSELFRVQPCRRDLVPYLEAEYRCVQVSGFVEAGSSARACNGSAIPLQGTSGFLASHVTRNTGAGSERCPWLIEAKEGQRITVTIKVFSSPAQKTTDKISDAAALWSASGQSTPDAAVADCPRVAQVRESLEERSKSSQFLQLCPGSVRRSVTYTSTSHRLYVNFVEGDVTASRVFVHFDVIGCPDVTAPRNAWLTRSGDTLLVVCNYTSERWYIACSGREWVSPLSNCSSASLNGIYLDNEQGIRQPGSFPVGLLMAVAAGAIIGISIGFGCLLIICVGRKRWKDKRHVQNTENSNRENVYKLIDLWAKPELHCDCAAGVVLQPEVTCDCMLPEMRRRQQQQQQPDGVVVDYISSSDYSASTTTRTNGVTTEGNERRGKRGGREGDLGPPARPRPLGGVVDDHAEVFSPSRNSLQRCTCSSGKCRHDDDHVVTAMGENGCGRGEDRYGRNKTTSATSVVGSSSLIVESPIMPGFVTDVQKTCIG